MNHRAEELREQDCEECRYCGECIRWATSAKSGKRFPLNITSFEPGLYRGNFILAHDGTDEGDYVATWTPNNANSQPEDEVWEAHAATCGKGSGG